MSDSIAGTYREVCRHARQTAVLASVNELLGWDERTQLPPAGGEHRAEQSTMLAGMVHRRWIDPKFGEQLEQLVGTELPAGPAEDTAVIVRRLKRQATRR